MPSTSTLDDLDRAILGLYQHDTRRTAQAIGDSVGLSAAAVQRRIKRLRESGAIVAEIARLDGVAVGLPVTVIVHVDIERETSHHIDAFRQRMLARGEVQQCWFTTGLTDFVLVVRVPSLQGYEAFAREELMDRDNIKCFTSYVALGEVKGGLALELPAA